MPEASRFEPLVRRLMEDREVMAMAETRRCEWCREIAHGACGCAAEVEIQRLREALHAELLSVGVHSCSAVCSRSSCVNARIRRALTELLESRAENADPRMLTVREEQAWMWLRQECGVEDA